jgi:hypothetical protein
MNIGNIVMFTSNGRYAKYFFGQLAEVVSNSISKTTGKEHVRVKWYLPVKYYDNYTTISDFSADKFTLVVKE